MKYFHDNQLLERARSLRKQMTPQERKLWYLFLRRRKEKWYRQRPMFGYILDFYCADVHLAVEIDGGQHFTDTGRSYDENRTAVLTQNGITVLRFTNADIEHRFDTVCDEIGRKAKQNANNPGGIE